MWIKIFSWTNVYNTIKGTFVIESKIIYSHIKTYCILLLLLLLMPMTITLFFSK